jgi:rubrerythrin
VNDANITASAIMSFSEKLEEQSMAFYEQLARRFDEQRDTFLRFAKECKKNKIHLVRTYQETISDALEATFSFETLEFPEIKFDSLMDEEASFTGVVSGAAAIERQASEFYTEVADQSQSLLATIPRAFKRVAKARRSRSETLMNMLS